MEQRACFSLLVENEAGVLSRIAGLFTRRSYNINSLSVGVTMDPEVSRMTVVTTGDPVVFRQIEKQLAKLVDVREIRVLPMEDSVLRELVLVKVLAKPEERAGLIGIANIFRANIVDVAPLSMTMEVTGNKSKIDAFLRLLEDTTEVSELARTGVTGLQRGITDYED